MTLVSFQISSDQMNTAIPTSDSLLQRPGTAQYEHFQMSIFDTQRPTGNAKWNYVVTPTAATGYDFVIYKSPRSVKSLALLVRVMRMDAFHRSHDNGRHGAQQPLSIHPL